MATYGTVEVWLNQDPAKLTDKQAWCDAWLCPQEFSGRRIYELIQESSTSASPHALMQLRRALRLDAASAYSWADLADAEMNARHVEAAKYCFQRALAAGPLNPVILFRAANFDFQIGDQEGTLHFLRRVLTHAGSAYYDSTFLIYSRLDLPIQQVLAQGLPTSRPVAEAFLHYWMDARKLQESQATWEWMRGNGLVNDQLAGDYVSYLIHERLFEQAADTWQSFASKQFPQYRTTNWVFNGSFDHEPTESPLDWHIEKSRDIEVVRTPSGGRNNKAALQVKFLGTENVDFRHVSQTAVVEAGRWKFAAWIKADDLTTNEGVGIHLYGLGAQSGLDWRSKALSGTTTWQCIEYVFDIVPEARLLKIDFVRSPSRKFDNKIRGTFRIDSVHVSPAR